ncbi:DUF4956 domain-containing protein [Candidatus Saccharibacteria bacterium]|nr:DUF4956 domain-containing protein [Candidatus Saccharibacteria bacterium]MBR3204739.1 DUF4956 domain-containing protein [Candidatus Saccharibacteria bacterium]
MFNSIFDSSSSALDAKSILVSSSVAILLGLVIAFTHLKTSKTSKNFLITLTILPLLVEVVMIMVNGSLGTSIAILGAFSLIRFRSIAGNSKEISSVFFAMAIGLALGMGHILFAAVITAIVVFLILFLSKVNVFNLSAQPQTLQITIPEDLDYTGAFNDIFKKYASHVELVNSRTTNMGSLYQLTYDINLKKTTNEKEFLDAIRVRNSNLKVILSRSTRETLI